MKTIQIDKEILGGTPVFYGSRVPVKNLFEYLEAGDDINGFLSDYPSVKKEQVIKVLELSHKILHQSTELLNEDTFR